MSSNLYDKTTQKLIPYAGNSESTVASLDSLSNVYITSPIDGQLLTYDATSNQWKNADRENAEMELNEISDVMILSVSNGQILRWNETLNKWVNSDYNEITSLGSIPNVYLDQLESGQILIYESSSGKWINTTLEYQRPLVPDYGISIDSTNNKIKTKTFVGTISEWDSLNLMEQMSYDFINITDDASSAQSYDTQIAYVNELPSTGNIHDIVYGLQNYGSVATATAADGFLDNVAAFSKVALTSEYEYVSDLAIISVDNLSFYPFSAITYDGTKFVISWGQGVSEATDLALGDTLYYKVMTSIDYYGGHYTTQTLNEFTYAIDDVPTQSSNNPVKSGGVYTALSTLDGEKLDTYVSDSSQWDTTPTASSTKPVTSGGVKTELNKKTDQTVIATRQSNLTASRKYEIGEQFIYNNTLYKATAVINKDAAITIGGNATTENNITTQISNFTKNVAGTKIDLASHTSLQNAYTTLTDGYIYLNNQGNANLDQQVLVYDTAGNNIAACRNYGVGTFRANSLYVKKGLKLWRSDGSTAGVAWFFPLKS